MPARRIASAIALARACARGRRLRLRRQRRPDRRAERLSGAVPRIRGRPALRRRASLPAPGSLARGNRSERRSNRRSRSAAVVSSSSRAARRRGSTPSSSRRRGVSSRPERVDAIVGGASVVARDLAHRYPDVPFVTTFWDEQEVTLRRPAANLFRFQPDYAQEAAGLGTYAYRTLGLAPRRGARRRPDGRVGRRCRVHRRVLLARRQGRREPLPPALRSRPRPSSTTLASPAPTAWPLSSTSSTRRAMSSGRSQPRSTTPRASCSSGATPSRTSSSCRPSGRS